MLLALFVFLPFFYWDFVCAKLSRVSVCSGTSVWYMWKCARSTVQLPCSLQDAVFSLQFAEECRNVVHVSVRIVPWQRDVGAVG